MEKAGEVVDGDEKDKHAPIRGCLTSRQTCAGCGGETFSATCWYHLVQRLRAQCSGNLTLCLTYVRGAYKWGRGLRRNASVKGVESAGRRRRRGRRRAMVAAKEGEAFRDLKTVCGTIPHVSFGNGRTAVCCAPALPVSPLASSLSLRTPHTLPASRSFHVARASARASPRSLSSRARARCNFKLIMHRAVPPAHTRTSNNTPAVHASAAERGS